MILLALAAAIVAFYLGTALGCWLTGKGRESAYLEGARDGMAFARRRPLVQPRKPAKDCNPEEAGAA